MTHYFNKVVSIECAEDVLSSSSEIRTEVCLHIPEVLFALYLRLYPPKIFTFDYTRSTNVQNSSNRIILTLLYSLSFRKS